MDVAWWWNGCKWHHMVIDIGRMKNGFNTRVSNSMCWTQFQCTKNLTSDKIPWNVLSSNFDFNLIKENKCAQTMSCRRHYYIVDYYASEQPSQCECGEKKIDKWTNDGECVKKIVHCNLIMCAMWVIKSLDTWIWWKQIYNCDWLTHAMAAIMWHNTIPIDFVRHK